jgi:hypothetical protein
MRLVGALALVVILVPACSGGHRAAVARPHASKRTHHRAHPVQAVRKRSKGRDLAWLARVHRWEMRLGTAYDKSSRTYAGVQAGNRSRQELRAALRPLVHCTRSLHRNVRAPRSAPYPPVYKLLERGCKNLERTSRALDRTLGGDREQAIRELKRSRPRVETYFSEAHDEIQWRMRANRTLPTRGGLTSVSRFEPRLSRAGSELVFREKKGVEVKCWSKREWPLVRSEYTTYFGTRGRDVVGFTQDTSANISPEACRVLAAFVYRGSRPASGTRLGLTAASVGLLSHELQHVSDSWPSEAVTECNGMQQMGRLGRLLGASPSYSRLLTKMYWLGVYPNEPPQYRTKACRSGGRLDRSPGDGVWP